MKAPTPTVHAMVLCDHIFRDAATGRWDLLGVFEWLHAEAAPLKNVAFDVYTAMTGLKGTYEFGLTVLGPDGAEVARYGLGARVNAHDPSRRLQVGFCVTGLTLPRFGRYALRLTANGSVVAELALDAVPEGGQPGDEQ